MKKAIYSFGLLVLFLILTEACTQQNSSVQKTFTTEDSLANCEPTVIKDPNNPKPMALLMRRMAADADSMRSILLRGEKLDSNNYPFVKFYLVEPTDPKVLQMQFFENARLYQLAHQELFKHPQEQKKFYNMLINSCIRCHESYCTGPLKRIRKFPIP